MNNETTGYAIHFLKRKLQCFAWKTFQNVAKGVEKVQHLPLCATCEPFGSFWSQNVGKRSTKTELKMH